MSLEIRDTGIIIYIKQYSESSLIVKIFSEEHGICSGFVKGAKSNKKDNSIYQIANLVGFSWRAKTEDNLGFLKIELQKSYLAKIIFNNLKLNCVTAIFEVIRNNILEKESHQDLFRDILFFLNSIDCDDQEFLGNYVRLELNILKLLGYGIDLSGCAVTGQTNDLSFISPKSGRAVSKEAGLPYQNKLLKLPEFLVNNKAEIKKGDILLGLNLTNFFFKKYLIDDNQKFFETRSKIISAANSIL